jgi:hypothetical protein
MEITYTRRYFTRDGLGEREGPFLAPLGYFLFVEAACYFGVLPPFSMLNKTLSKGRLISAGGAVLEWRPQRIGRLQYEELKHSLEDHPEWGGEVDDNFRGSRKYWERWAILRTVDKMTPASA